MGYCMNSFYVINPYVLSMRNSYHIGLFWSRANPLIMVQSLFKTINDLDDNSGSDMVLSEYTTI